MQQRAPHLTKYSKNGAAPNNKIGGYELNKIYLEEINEDSIRKFTECVLISYEALRKNEPDWTWRMDHADRAIDILFTILEEKKIFNRTRRPYLNWVNILISSTYIYYAVKNRLKPGSFMEFFEIRQNFADNAEKAGMNPQTFDVLCQAVEAANGDDGVPNCKPVPGTPTELMSLAIFFEQKILSKYDKSETD